MNNVHSLNSPAKFSCGFSLTHLLLEIKHIYLIYENHVQSKRWFTCSQYLRLVELKLGRILFQP